LRTPLNGILGYAQVLRRDPGQTADARERLGVIVSSGEHLLALINEVLDLAKVEAGKMELHPAEFALPQLIQGVADLVRPRCEEKNLAFGVTLAPGLPRLVRSDEQKLRQVLLNLLVNAIRFTATGHVTLTAAPAGAGRVRFTVEDTGSGIDPARLPRLFQPFDSTGQGAAQGTGLGLALSQRMTELLGGQIEVGSTPGHGSRFWFDLPLAAVNPSASATPVPRTPIGYRGDRRHLLVVDDDATNRAVLCELLAPLGFAVTEAADGEAAVAAFDRTPTDLVLLDLRFESGPDGFAIARSLRTTPQGDRTRIVAVSASVFESDRHQALAAGCDAFLAKPFKEEQLHALLGDLLGLTWEYAAEPAVPAGGTVPLDDATRVELLDLARRGDAHRLRERLAALAADPRHAAWARQLDALAAGFQMKRLRELLAPDAPGR
jgi:CheY-like chemotaxis protein